MFAVAVVIVFVGCGGVCCVGEWVRVVIVVVMAVVVLVAFVVVVGVVVVAAWCL